MNEFLRLRLEFGIIAHEGRHAIDMLNHPILFNFWTDEKEFRAKLSQVVFSSDPKLAILDIFTSRDIGSNTPHGKANKRIIKIIVEWMQKHTQEISGIDTTRPLLPQFDRLSFNQIKAILIAADPMSAETAMKGK